MTGNPQGIYRRGYAGSDILTTSGAISTASSHIPGQPDFILTPPNAPLVVAAGTATFGRAVLTGFVGNGSIAAATNRVNNSSGVSSVGIVMTQPGSIIGLSLKTTTTNSGATMTVKVTVNGTTGTLAATVINGATTGYNTEATGTDTFVAGDEISLKVTGATSSILFEGTITVQYSA